MNPGATLAIPPNNSTQRTARRAAADATRQARDDAVNRKGVCDDEATTQTT